LSGFVIISITVAVFMTIFQFPQSNGTLFGVAAPPPPIGDNSTTESATASSPTSTTSTTTQFNDTISNRRSDDIDETTTPPQQQDIEFIVKVFSGPVCLLFILFLFCMYVSMLQEEHFLP
jgi:hypothetical protein